jgi:hypothetical protein
VEWREYIKEGIPTEVCIQQYNVNAKNVLQIHLYSQQVYLVSIIIIPDDENKNRKFNKSLKNVVVQ